MNEQVKNVLITRVTSDGESTVRDQLAVEDPLEIQVIYSSATGKMKKNIAITMRTPGHDENLAAGFLFTEGVIAADAIAGFSCGMDRNRIIVELKENIVPNFHNSERNFYSSSSCGICGKASIESTQLNTGFRTDPDTILLNRELIHGLPLKLRSMQDVFDNTGGIHACGLFNLEGNCIGIREDVGRHNALDKLIGANLDRLPLAAHILLLSGRASFELLQKAAMAGIRIVVAVGAPSSLAVELAEENGITLIGFLRENRFNVYAGKERIS